MALAKKVVALFLSLAVVTVAFGIFLIAFHARIVRYQLSSDLRLLQGSEAVRLWSKRPDFPVYYEITVFDYDNDLKSSTPVGPYRFVVKKAKLNITFDGVDHVNYVESRVFTFIQTANLSLSDRITTYNNGPVDRSVGEVVQSLFPNNTQTSFAIKTGYTSIENAGYVVHVNETPLYEHKFYGYNVGPDVKEASKVYLFDADFCMTRAFHYVSSHSVNGTNLLMFMHDTGDVVEREACSRDHQEKPYEIVEQAIDQMHKPSYVDVEPFTGWIMKSAFRRQINSNASGVSLPILSYEESAEASEQTSEQLDDLVFYKMRIINSVAGYFILAGVTMLLILLVAHVRTRRASSPVTTPTIEVPADTMFKL